MLILEPLVSETGPGAFDGFLQTPGIASVHGPRLGRAGEGSRSLHYAASTLLCVPNSLSQPGRAALGGQAGGLVIGDVLADAGFTVVHRAHTTPVHAVYAARR